MGKSTRYLGDGESFSFDHAKVHSQSRPAQRFADGGAVARSMSPQPMAPARPRMDSNAVAGKAALGGYLLGEAKGAQEARGGGGGAMRSPMAPSAAPAQPLPNTGFARGGRVEAPKNPNLAPMVRVTKSVDAPLPNGGFAKGGVVRSDAMQDKALVKKGISQHETQEHGGKHSTLHLAKGGKVKRAHKPKSHKPPVKQMRGALSSAPMKVAAPPPMPMAAPAPTPARMPRRAPMAAPMSEMAAPSPSGAVPRLARGGKAPCR